MREKNLKVPFVGSLLEAIQINSFDLVRTLLAAGADPNGVEDGDKITPLHYAVSYAADQAIFELLVRYGADSSAKNRESLTPLDLAISLNEVAIADLLKNLSTFSFSRNAASRHLSVLDGGACAA